MIDLFSKKTNEVLASIERFDYKWIALSNTTLGALMAGIDANILLIALPAIFRGIGINPLAPGEINYLLWTLMSYITVLAVLLVGLGKMADMFGRVRMYNLGFLIFSIGSILLFFVQGTGNSAALQIIFFRVIQGIGGAMLLANSAAILTDAFPANERGFALGVNQIAFIAGSFIGLLLGGFLAVISWRLVFFVSVPFGLLGTIWGYMMLKEKGEIRPNQQLDIAGNILLAGGLTALLVSITYGIIPYGSSAMGWGNPFVIGGVLLGILLLVIFAWHETKVKHPLFNLELFGIAEFATGNAAGFLYSLARGGLQFMLIIWLQGIWLPLHGFAFEDTPLWGAVYLLPLTIAFLVFGPLSGYLSDKHGPRLLATAGSVLMAIGFFGLMLLPANFAYWQFACIIALIGAGTGMFAAPNTSAVMSSVPPHQRGVASGMRATFQNAASALSISIIFTLFTVGMAASLPATMYAGLTGAGISSQAAAAVSNLPPTGMLFATFLGYNPLGSLLPQAELNSLSSAVRQNVLGTTFFPDLISPAFIEGTKLAFAICAVVSLIAAGVSFMRGKEKHKHHAHEASAMH
jgi:MFS family permease